MKDQIAQHCLSDEEAMRRVGARAQGASTWARKQRKADALFGVWSSKDQLFVHPDFQFGGAATEEQRKALFRILRTRVGFDPVQEDKGGWARAYWLYQPHPDLSIQALAAQGMVVRNTIDAALALRAFDDRPRVPADVFQVDPEEVIALAMTLSAREDLPAA